MLTLLALLGASASHAETVNYPAIGCQVDEDNRGAMVLTKGLITNESATYDLDVHCPVHNARRSTTFGSIEGYVVIRDGNDSDDVTCRLRAEYPVSGSRNSSGWIKTVSSTSSNGENETLTFPQIRISAFGAAPDVSVYYSLQCELPEDDDYQSALVYYQMEDN